MGAYLASLSSATDGDFKIEIIQGVQMGRPSEIKVRARKSQGQVNEVEVSGRCIQVMEGVLQIGEWLNIEQPATGAAT